MTNTRVESAITTVRRALPTLLADVVAAELRFLDSRNPERLDRLISEIHGLKIARGEVA